MSATEGEAWDFDVFGLPLAERVERAEAVADRLFERRRVAVRATGLLVTYAGHTTSPRLVLSWRTTIHAQTRIVLRGPDGRLADHAAVCDAILARQGIYAAPAAEATQ